MSRTVEQLEAVLKAWDVRKCVHCGEYELPERGGGVGGIQASSMGKDRDGNDAHAGCAMNRNRRK